MPQFESMVVPPRLPLVVLTASRDDTFTRDSGLVNCYIERTVQNEIFIIKRGGLLLANQTAAFGNLGRGVYRWRGDVYSIFAGTLYRNNVVVATGLNELGGVYRFESILGATPKLVINNGKKTYAYTVGGGLTSALDVIDVDFPSLTVKGPVYLNGTLFVMNTSAEIWNSAVNDITNVTSWGALNFIASQAEPDAGVALAKQLVYVVAFNEWSTEFFYYAGTPSGSPLGVSQGSKVTHGCLNADSVQSSDDQLFWLSTSKEASKPQVSMLDQGTHSIISTPAIERLLNGCTTSNVYSMHLKLDGHSFYVLTFPIDNLTIVYDIKEQLWHRWTDAYGRYFPYVSSTSDSSGNIILQHEENGSIYYFNSSYYTDDDEAMAVDIYTPIFDANTVRRKILNSLTLVGDQTVGSVVQVRHSDNDYLSWSNFRTLNMGTRCPTLGKCGTFKRRAYHLKHRSATPMRLQYADVEYDLGTL